MRSRTIAWAVAGIMVMAWTALAADFVKGKVVEIDQEARTVTLDHGDIPNLEMPGMTMTFRIGEGVDAAALMPGSEVEFTADNIGDEITVTEVRASP